MATSGVTDFTVTFDDILQDAAGMVGGGPILAEELLSAKRGLDNLLIAIQNKGPLLHKIVSTTLPAVVDQQDYILPNSVVDVLKVMLRQDNKDVELVRLGFKQWAEIYDKNLKGRPTSYWFDRTRTQGTLRVWPRPDSPSYSFVVTYQQVAEQTLRAFEEVDVPRRFWPALTFGLAYWVGLRRSDKVSEQRLALLRAEYETALQDALREDRERASFYIRRPE